MRFISLLFIVSLSLQACAQMPTLGQNVPPAPERSALLLDAMGYIGTPYARGGNTGATGLDCSGFVKAVFAQAEGITLPRSAHEQANATVKIDLQELQPGDLVFYNTLRRAYSHVGIYLGDGRFIHSPRAGSQVRIESMNGSYWLTRFNGARRVLPKPTISKVNAKP